MTLDAVADMNPLWQMQARRQEMSGPHACSPAKKSIFSEI